MSGINKVIDHVTFLHMDSTMHWHTHDDKIDFVMEMLEFQQFLMQNLKQMMYH